MKAVGRMRKAESGKQSERLFAAYCLLLSLFSSLILHPSSFIPVFRCVCALKLVFPDGSTTRREGGEFYGAKLTAFYSIHRQRNSERGGLLSRSKLHAGSEVA